MEKTKLSRFLLKLTNWTIYLLVFAIPLVYLPFTLDALEINKQTVLVLLTLIAALAWLLRIIVDKRVEWRQSKTHFLFIAFFFSTLISATISLAQYRSWIGNAAEEYTSVLTFFALILFYFLVVNHCHTIKIQRWVRFLFLSSSLIVGVIGLLSVFGVSILPAPTFNTIGTINSFGLFMVVAAVFANVVWISHQQEDMFFKAIGGLIEQFITLAIPVLTIVLLLIIDYWVLWFLFAVGLVLAYVFVFLKPKNFPIQARSVFPVLLLIVAVPFMFWLDSPLPVTVPQEVTPSYSGSWSITKETLKETSVLFGSGPGTFQFDYSKYHGTDVNETMFWDMRFNSGASFLLTMLPTIGFLGAILMLVIFGFVGIKAGKDLIEAKDLDDWFNMFLLIVPFSILFLVIFLYGMNLSLLFTLFLLSGLLMSRGIKNVHTRSFTSSKGLGLSISFIFIIVAVGLLTVVFATGQRYSAEIAFAKGVRLDRSGAPTIEVVEKLDQAASTNKWNDIYYRNLSLTHLHLVNEKLQSLPVIEEASDEDVNLIKALTGASINSAKRAVELSPNNVANLNTLGSVYREFSPFMDNASDFAIESFEKAAELEPSNPEHQTEIGKSYLSAAENLREFAMSEDEALKNRATRELEVNLAKAQKAFEKAIELKADYAPAHFQLALVYERAGRVNDAVGKMESVLEYNQLDVGVLFQLGLLYMRRQEEGDLDRAQLVFERSIELVPSYSNARWFLASVYEMQGNMEAAIEQVIKVKEIDPANPLVNARLERLQNGGAPEEALPIDVGEAPGQN